jgi:hypothetical protein
MMNYLYLIPPADKNGDLFPSDGTAVLLGVTSSGHRKCLSSRVITNVTVVGSWGNNGEQSFLDLQLYEDHFTPFMNSVEGFATDQQNIHHWQGHDMRHMQETPVANTKAVYPVDRQPFVVTMSRYEKTTGGWPGWYWSFVVEFIDPNRPPDARTVGIYDEHWNYLYTVGALVEENILVGQDPDGNPIFEKKWVGRCPPGRQTTVPGDIYYALLFGSAQEGKMILASDQMRRVNHYWEHTETV